MTAGAERSKHATLFGATGQWGRSEGSSVKGPPWEVVEPLVGGAPRPTQPLYQKAFTADLTEPQGPGLQRWHLPGGACRAVQAGPVPSTAHSWNAQMQADLSARVSPPQAISLSPSSPLVAYAPRGASWEALYILELHGLCCIWGQAGEGPPEGERTASEP